MDQDLGPFARLLWVSLEKSSVQHNALVQNGNSREFFCNRARNMSAFFIWLQMKGKPVDLFNSMILPFFSRMDYVYTTRKQRIRNNRSGEHDGYHQTGNIYPINRNDPVWQKHVPRARCIQRLPMTVSIIHLCKRALIISVDRQISFLMDCR